MQINKNGTLVVHIILLYNFQVIEFKNNESFQKRFFSFHLNIKIKNALILIGVVAQHFVGSNIII